MTGGRQHCEPDAWALAEAIRSGTTTASALLEATLDRIHRQDGEINAFTVLLAASARQAASAVDTDLAAGRPLGPLAGVPVSVKDHIWVRDAPATNGSRALEKFLPDADCGCVARLRQAGAVIVGKTNNPEFCYRGFTDNDLFGVTRNPHDLTRTSGGSSGGAAASVAAGMVPLALGTDGGGSIRIPSAFCGVYGLKPTFGLVAKLPGFRGWPTLSVTGPIAGSVRDLALAISVLAGTAIEDDLSYPAPTPSISCLQALVEPDWGGLRIACSADLGLARIDPDVRAVFERAVGLIESALSSGSGPGSGPGWGSSSRPSQPDGGVIRLARDHPEPQDPSLLWDPVALAEGWASEGDLLTAHPDLLGADAAAIVAAGADVTARQYLDAQHARTRLTAEWGRFFERYDVLITPTMPVTAFETGQLGPPIIDGEPQPDSFDAWCALALPANLTGMPALTIPAGTGAHGLPVGLQLLGPRWSEPTLIRVAALVDDTLRAAG